MLSRMVGNSRSELASSSLEGASLAAYPNIQRGTYSTSSLERPGSFRESVDNRVLSSGPGAIRCPASVSSTDIPSPSQCLMLESFSLGDQKFSRAGELRRVLGISVEEHSSLAVQPKTLGPAAVEELKRLRNSVCDSASKAKERTEVLHDLILKLEKYRSLISRKRQRSGISPGDRSGGANILKMGSQLHQSSDIAAQRLEERSKSAVPNKRMRSMVMADVRVEGRPTITSRQAPTIEKDKTTPQDKDKNMLRACNGGSMNVEDKIRVLPAGGEGWEKKMKRKRSVAPVATRPDGDREKPALQQRLNIESRVRPSDSIGFRSSASSVIVGSNKNDTSTQLCVAGTRPITKNDFENVSLPSDRKERSSGLDKERNMAKGGNKLTIREESQPGSQSPLTKSKASRGPRTGLSCAMNSSNFQRAPGSMDGVDQPSGLSKMQLSIGVNNRKTSLPNISSPSTVTQWTNQRPPKNTRKRRTSLVSPVSSHSEPSVLPEGFPLDVGIRHEDSTSIHSRGFTSIQPPKLKPDNVSSPATVSESEESGVAENRSKDKGSSNYEVEDGIASGLQKATTSGLPSKKNKPFSREEIGDGVRRQGRSGRGSSHPKSSISKTKEKLEQFDTSRSHRTGRPGCEISKLGRPPSRKTSDRKAYSRPSHSTNSSSSDLIGETDDRDELLLAAQYARNASSKSCSSSAFWNKMEHIFSFVSEHDIVHLKQQVRFVEEVDESIFGTVDTHFRTAGEHVRQVVSSVQLQTVDSEDKQAASNLVEVESSMGITSPVDDSGHIDTKYGKLEGDRWLENTFPLSQRLLAAFIDVEENENGMYDYEFGNEDIVLSASDYSSYTTTSHVSFEARDADRMESEYESDLTFITRKNSSRDNSCNGCSISSSFRSPDIQTASYSNEFLQEDNLSFHNNHSEYGQDINERTSIVGSDISGSPHECQYENRCLDDKIMIELQSIGLYLETVPGLSEAEDDELDRDLSALKAKLYEQMRRKKRYLRQLDKAIQSARVMSERKLEQIAMDKLVEIASKKFLGGRGSHGSSHKSGANKISKQVAIAFAKRVLVECRKFENNGSSCFSESSLRDALFSSPPHGTDAKTVNSVVHAAASNACADGCNSQQGNQLVASVVITSTAERNGLAGHEPDVCARSSPLSDQAFTKHEPLSNRNKKKEVLLDDVGGTASRTSAVLSYALPGGVKGKRSERDRDQNMLMRNSVPKGGCPSLSSGRGERKTKMKPKQRTSLLSSGNGFLGRFTEANSMHESSEAVNGGFGDGNEAMLSGSERPGSSKDVEETIDFTNLPLDSIDADLGGQGQDIGSWLNIGDDVLQDNDLIMGLEIPMDDLAELNMNF